MNIKLQNNPKRKQSSDGTSMNMKTKRYITLFTFKVTLKVKRIPIAKV